MLKDTAGYPVPSPLSDNFAERMGTRKQAVHHLLCPSSPLLVSKHLLFSGLSFHSAHETTLEQSHSPPGSQPVATNIQRHLSATLAFLHTNIHASLMAAACRTLGDISVVFPFSPSAYGNLAWEGSISLQPTLPLCSATGLPPLQS